MSLTSNCSTTSGEEEPMKDVASEDGSSIDVTPSPEPQPQRPSQSADIFGVQMEVTNLLLVAERRRLGALQRDLKERFPVYGSDAYGRRELEQQQRYIKRIEQQYEQLLREYEQAAVEVLRNYCRSNRSQPAFGVKTTTKSRPSIFGTVAGTETLTQMSADLRGASSSAKCNSHRWTSMGSLGSGGTHDDRSSAGSASDESASNSQRSSDQSLIFENSILSCGTLDALIHHLIPSADYYPDRTYIFAFLLSSRLFIKPPALLEQVVDACSLHRSLYPNSISVVNIGTFSRNIMRLLGEWTDTFAFDFRDERMMKSLKEITHFCLTFVPEARKDVGQILQNLLSRLSTLEKYEEQLAEINQEATNRISTGINPTTDIFELSSEPLKLALHLTSIELERLRFIGPEEFVQAFAKENSSTPLCDMKRTRNLEAYVQWFNRLSYLVATEICMQLKKRHRVRMLDFFIDVAKECFNLGNFNSLMAIIAGLNMSPVRRLKRTWAKVNIQKFEILEHQMDPSGNFNSYRSTLKAAMWRSEGASNEREKVIIPFFSLLVKDLYFLNEGCANRQASGHVNFEKFWQLAKQITEFLTWKQASAPVDKNSRIVKYLLTNPIFSENALALASFECEAPENNYERTRSKQLKAELTGAKSSPLMSK